MATSLYFTNSSPDTQLGTNTANLRGSNIGWDYLLGSGTRGNAAVSLVTNTVAGPTAGVELTTTNSYEFISEPIDADVTISGTITMNLRAAESAAQANTAINCKIERIDSTGAVVSTILTTTRVTELTMSEAAANFTGTPTSTNMLKGDRFRITVFGDDAGTMGSGRTFTFWFDGPTAAASGDSYVSFTETFGFLTTAPAGSVLYLTTTAGPAVGADIELEAWTVRGAGVATAVINSVAGWTAPIQFTQTAGGTKVEWYTKPLVAFTLTGLVTANLRALVSSAAIVASIGVEIAVVAGDGSGAVVWAAARRGGNNNGRVTTTTEFAYSVTLAGDDVAVTDGQRLRIRILIDDGSLLPMVTGHTMTFFYNGTTAAATGDSYLTLTQTVTEFSDVLVPRYGFVHHNNPGVL